MAVFDRIPQRVPSIRCTRSGVHALARRARALSPSHTFRAKPSLKLGFLGYARDERLLEHCERLRRLRLGHNERRHEPEHVDASGHREEPRLETGGAELST